MKRLLRAGLIGVLVGVGTVGILFWLIVPSGFRTALWKKVGPFHIDPPFKAGEKFPDLALKSVEGKTFRISEHPHKVLLVNFFTTW